MHFFISIEKSFKIKAKWQMSIGLYFLILKEEKTQSRIKVDCNLIKKNKNKKESLDLRIKVYYENIFVILVIK